MSYMTDFTLNVYDLKSRKRVSRALAPEALETLQAEIDRMNVFSDCDLTVGLNAYAKWYDSDEDMCLLSSKFPNLLFELAGIGEDSQLPHA